MAFRHRDHRHDTVAQARACEAAPVLAVAPTHTPIHTPGCEGGACGTYDRCNKHRREDAAASGNWRDRFRAYND